VALASRIHLAANSVFLINACTTVLCLANVSKRFPGVQALDGVDFSLERGEIHCLVGENGSGKSTLIKIIAGVESPDAGGRIEVDGSPVRHWQSTRAIRRGIEVIYQDLSLFPNLSVAENIALGQLQEEKVKWVRRRRLRQIADETLRKIGAQIDLDTLVGRLPLADQQLVAIARALTTGVRLLIMDEPTTSLTRREIDALFSAVKDLEAKGITTLFVSHKLDEVFEIAQRVTVLRDSKCVGTFACEELSPERLAFLMSGVKPDQTRYEREATGEKPVLEVKGLSKRDQFHDVNFRLLPGEIVGLAGLLGSGRAELALSLFGLNPPDAGEVWVDGRRRAIRSVQDAIRLGIGLVPENRAIEGLVMAHSVGRNAVLSILDHLRNPCGLLNRHRLSDAMSQTAERLAIRAASLDVRAETLSGGNQQRLVLAKWLATRPRVLIMHGPTVGIDIAAKSEIHKIMRDLAKGGMSILIISDEVRELLTCCNRILLMTKGRITREWETAEISEAKIEAALLGA